ncbi:hypothetical protein SARC_07179 [Sphaeroforma arctica JP610]|uniref:Ubiquitin-like domain-containing protein n=1 Tax=Sphaeroforma arctica JP610 TaxID=667725 RepID=A0A0L0FWX7_9EUKA|nr:hypothetical protein SARC_07179 [Sphaeroforma arctica JP610]KNC80463.1 hypothetical protein SARC_07179 [Sphaeroforma arctica JP610]|eukprot:XP_014154365.1 hypothetical protein SARC_07179 [Sphaeroforma arctica JP610]
MNSEASSVLNRDVDLVVKTTDGKCSDLNLKCPLDTTVVQVMHLIKDHHPYKPDVSQQRLIYLGRLWVNSMSLRASLREPDVDKIQTVHLLVKDSPNPRSSTSGIVKATTSTLARAAPAQTTAHNAERIPDSHSQVGDQRVSGRSVEAASFANETASIESTTTDIENENKVLKERLRQMEARMNSDPVINANVSNEETMRLWKVYYSYVLQHYHTQTQLYPHIPIHAQTPSQPHTHPHASPTYVPMSWPEYYHQQLHTASRTPDMNAPVSSSANNPHTPQSQAQSEQSPVANAHIPEAAPAVDEYDDGDEDIAAQQAAVQNYNRTFLGQVGIFLKLCLLMYVFGREATTKKQIMLTISAFIVFLYQTGRLDFIITTFRPPPPAVPTTTAPAPAPEPASASDDHTEGNTDGASSSSSTDSSSSGGDSSEKGKAKSERATSTQHPLSRQNSPTVQTSELSTGRAEDILAGSDTPDSTQTEAAAVVEPRPSLLHEIETFLFNFVSSLLPSAQADGNAIPPEVEDNGPAGNIFG